MEDFVISFYTGLFGLLKNALILFRSIHIYVARRIFTHHNSLESAVIIWNTYLLVSFSDWEYSVEVIESMTNIFVLTTPHPDVCPDPSLDGG